jgi:hypothetical protein
MFIRNGVDLVFAGRTFYERLTRKAVYSFPGRRDRCGREM